MVQHGLALKRLIAIMAANRDKRKSFQFSKLDIKDGFWHMTVGDDDACNFCYVLPSDDDNIDSNDIEIVVQNSDGME